MSHILPGGLPVKHRDEHEGYEYYRRDVVPRTAGGRCVVSVYAIPPLKSAYPYHYHSENEEVFYILAGHGILTSPEGRSAVSAGEFLVFPAGGDGAHKLTNDSPTEMLEYIDFSAVGKIDVAHYPDSGKIGIWGGGINRVFETADAVDYYKGE